MLSAGQLCRAGLDAEVASLTPPGKIVTFGETVQCSGPIAFPPQRLTFQQWLANCHKSYPAILLCRQKLCTTTVINRQPIIVINKKLLDSPIICCISEVLVADPFNCLSCTSSTKHHHFHASCISEAATERTAKRAADL